MLYFSYCQVEGYFQIKKFLFLVRMCCVHRFKSWCKMPELLKPTEMSLMLCGKGQSESTNLNWKCSDTVRNWVTLSSTRHVLRNCGKIIGELFVPHQLVRLQLICFLPQVSVNQVFWRVHKWISFYSLRTPQTYILDLLQPEHCGCWFWVRIFAQRLTILAGVLLLFSVRPGKCWEGTLN